MTLLIDNIKLIEERPVSIKKFSSKNNSYRDQRKKIKCLGCTGTLREIRFDDIIIIRTQIDFEKDFKSRFVISDKRILLYFVLEGSSFLHCKMKKTLKLQSGAHNIAHTERICGETQCPCGKYELFYISLSLKTFFSFFPKGRQVFHNFKQKMGKRELSLLREEPGIINHQIYKIIQDICRCEKELEVKKIFIKAKIIELLSLQLEQLCEICPPGPTLNKEDAEKMYAVRDFMLKHLGEYHSLKSLAKRVGTNEYTLKTEFKELFGTTVFGYWHNLKMEKAQNLLRDHQKPIKQISEIVGYKNPQHFSTAFKKKYGMAPSIYRKNNTNKSFS